VGKCGACGTVAPLLSLESPSLQFQRLVLQNKPFQDFVVVFLTKKRQNGAKVSEARWLCRFFFVISVDASRRALGRDVFFFVSARYRTGAAFMLQNGPFQDFLVIFRKKNDQTA